MKKILAFSSIRSEYDLMSPLYRLLHKDSDIDLRIMVSGAHLSHNFGYSLNQIKNDGFDVLVEIETLLNSDTELSRVKSASLLLQNSLEHISQFNPDLMIYAGDREDVLMYAIIGGYLNIPTIHVFAGDHTKDGYIDNSIRHAASKLSTAQFTTLEEHKERLIKMGESAERIHVVGNMSLDKFVDFEPIAKKKIREFFDVEQGFHEFSLVIFHPITEEMESADEYFKNILKNLEDRNIDAFVSYPNVDPGNNRLLSVIRQYEGNKRFVFYKNLDRNIFMSIYKHASFIIGNSSSGICEAASLKIPAINVGLRQTGRYADKNVVFCSAGYRDIGKSIDKVVSQHFQRGLKLLRNSYGDGNSAIRAYKIIKSTDFKSMIKKSNDPLEE